MTFAGFQLAVAYCGAFAVLATCVVCGCGASLRAIWRRGRGFAAVFAVFAVIATIHAQKMNLRVSNATPKGFDCAWDYGGLTPADFTDGETVKLTAQITGLDYTLLIGTLPPIVTNYHVNAVLRGLPRGWMAHDLKVTARLNNANLMGETNRDGDDTHELPSINDAEGGNE